MINRASGASSSPGSYLDNIINTQKINNRKRYSAAITIQLHTRFLVNSKGMYSKKPENIQARLQSTSVLVETKRIRDNAESVIMV